ncbi:MAG: biopolymer transporter ExbD [Acidobacteria bacterium]|nr:biopolymer transporter ExbD [Acidobacteriota bacterium]MBI3657093.1 biopolymer transporter ExbD [Acidobacteriota bacterium]
MAFVTTQGKVQSALSEINVTPLVDVMLVLLIIFMVTAPILQTGIDVELPRTRAGSKVNPEQHIIISLNKDNLLYFRSEPVNVHELGERLLHEIKDPKEHIFVQADGDVKYKTIVQIFDAIRAAGFAKIDLVTKPMDEKRRR